MGQPTTDSATGRPENYDPSRQRRRSRSNIHREYHPTASTMLSSARSMCAIPASAGEVVRANGGAPRAREAFPEALEGHPARLPRFENLSDRVTRCPKAALAPNPRQKHRSLRPSNVTPRITRAELPFPEALEGHRVQLPRFENLSDRVTRSLRLSKGNGCNSRVSRTCVCRRARMWPGYSSTGGAALQANTITYVCAIMSVGSAKLCSWSSTGRVGNRTGKR